MKITVKILTTIMSICLISAAAFAQDAPPPVVNVSGVLFTGFVYHLDNDNRPDPFINQHGFEIERAYLTFSKNLGDNWSMRATLDTYHNPSRSSDVYVRVAEAQYRNTFGNIDFMGRFGIIDNQLNSMLDRLGGMRWLSRNQMDALSIHPTADLGAAIEFGFMKMVTLNLSLMNGEGSNNATTTPRFTGVNTGWRGEEFNALVTVNPFSKLFLHGFYSYEKFGVGPATPDPVTGDKRVSAVDTHFGGGLAWNDSLYKAGVNITMIPDDFKSPAYNDGLYIDGWVNVNFKDLIGMPLTLNARVGYIAPDADGADNVITFGVGPGYKFNNNVQFALWLASQQVGDNDADMSIAVRSEIRF